MVSIWKEKRSLPVYQNFKTLFELGVIDLSNGSNLKMNLIL